MSTDLKEQLRAQPSKYPPSLQYQHTLSVLPAYEMRYIQPAFFHAYVIVTVARAAFILERRDGKLPT